MGTNAFKQIVRTIQNKIPVSKGLIRRSRETEQGYLADIHNFELEDGTLKFRQGTRLMANMVDELWYDIQSFKFGNTELVMGINYKRELWGWLAKWPETSFKIWNTSPFRRAYPHVNATSGKPETNGHFSFERGNKFYMLEDNFSVILVNDYAEIFRIMKNGCFRITADDDYADQREAIQDARDNDSLAEGRIYLDIKEATNRVFNERMYIGDEYIRRSHRITGETRFAWVNELNVVSELSDPIEIEGYRHVVVSKFPIVNINPSKKEIPVSRYVDYSATALAGRNIYEGFNHTVRIGATENVSWQPTNPNIVHTEQKAYGCILVVRENGAAYDDGGIKVYDIPVGIYMCITDNSGTVYELIDNEFNDNFVNIILQDTVRLQGRKLNISRLFQVYEYADDSFYRLTKTSFSAQIKASSVTNKISYDMAFNDTAGSWIRLSDTVPDYYPADRILISDTIGTKSIAVENGCFYEVEILMACADNAGNPDLSQSTWDNSIIKGMEIENSVTYGTWSCFKSKGYDCWQFNGEYAVSAANADLDKMTLTITDIPLCDVVLSASATDVFSSIDSSTSRMAVWNNSHIMGISQKAFSNSSLIVYAGSEQNETGNLNLSDPVQNISPGYLPLMTLDYTGLRRIPMPLPMIRRAMRNPQHLTTAGGKVYSVEDNKIWVGSVDDFMMTDFIEIHSAVDHIASMDTGIVVSTRQGLFYVASGEGIKRVIGGEMIMSKFLAPCSGGVLSVDGRDIHIIYKQVTDSGAWYPSVAKINNALTEINLEGEIKSVSIGDMIYIADDWNVWIYDMANKVWAGKKHYKNRIHRLFGYKNKLGVAFETGVDRRNSFPLERGEKE